jgi:DNA-directed RNA polymerase subunit RPC12/RpoP
MRVQTDDSEPNDVTKPVYPGPDVPLVCVECGRESRPGERGWRAYLGGGFDDELEIGIYCPECAARVFGQNG